MGHPPAPKPCCHGTSTTHDSAWVAAAFSSWGRWEACRALLDRLRARTALAERPRSALPVDRLRSRAVRLDRARGHPTLQSPASRAPKRRRIETQYTNCAKFQTWKTIILAQLFGGVWGPLGWVGEEIVGGVLRCLLRHVRLVLQVKACGVELVHRAPRLNASRPSLG